MDFPENKEQAAAFEAIGQDFLQIMLLLGKLADKINSQAPPAEINHLFRELLDLAVRHFALEERLMAERHYPGRHWHGLVHRELLNEMRLAAARSSESGTAVDRALLRRIRAVFSMESDDEDVFRARAKLGLFKEALPDIHPADLAAALPDFDREQRVEIFSDLDADQASGTLEEAAADIQRELVAALSIERVAELVDMMTPAQAAGVLRNLTPSEARAVLQQLGPVRARKVAALLKKQKEGSLADLATLRYIRAEPEIYCARLLAGYRGLAAQAAIWRYVYVLDQEGVLLGIADMRDVLMAEPTVKLAEVMMTNVVALTEADDVETAARLFDHYGFDALPLVDEHGVLKGVVPARDLLTVGDWVT
jgi:CBS domain-containing protein/hemerythrin